MSKIISDVDYHVLQQTAGSSPDNNRFFKKIMQKLRVVRDDLLPKSTVRLNSTVLLWHSFLKKTVRFRIVPPESADLKNKNISVFAPIGMAILGHRENDSVKVSIGGIEKELKIIKVINK